MARDPMDGLWSVASGRCLHFKYRNLMPDRVLRFATENGLTELDEETLLKQVWGITRETNDSDRSCLEGAMSKLRHALGEENVPKKAKNQGGYVLNAEAHSLASICPGIPKPAPIIPFESYIKLLEKAHPLSELGYGKNDEVEPAYDFSRFAQGVIPMIPYDNEDWALRIKVRHKVQALGAEEDEQESWWCASIGLAGVSSQLWEPVDLTDYRTLHISARAVTESDPHAKIPIRVRLKDNSRMSNACDGRQSTGPSRKFKLTARYPDSPHVIELKDLDWRADGWFDNTEPVDRASIHHLIIEQDHTMEACSAVILIRSIRFEP